MSPFLLWITEGFGHDSPRNEETASALSVRTQESFLTSVSPVCPNRRNGHTAMLHEGLPEESTTHLLKEWHTVSVADILCKLVGKRQKGEGQLPTSPISRDAQIF